MLLLLKHLFYKNWEYQDYLPLMSYYLARYIGIFCHSFWVTCVKDLWSSWTLPRLLWNHIFLNVYSMVFLINASFRVQQIKIKNQSKRFKCPEVEAQLCISYHFLFVVIFDFFSKTTGLISTKLDMKHFLVTGVYVFFLKNNFLKPIKLKSLYGSILR